MAKNIELYALPWSFYSMKARMYLLEKGVKPKMNLVDLISGENLTEEFIRLNPVGSVPVLKTSDSIVPDSEEIYKYGEDNIPGNNLIPADIAADIWRLHDIINGINVFMVTFGCLAHDKYLNKSNLAEKQRKEGPLIIPNFIKLLSNKLPSASSSMAPLISAKLDQFKGLLKKVEDKNEVETAIKFVYTVCGQCEAQLETSEGPFLFGATVTVADIDLIVLIMRMRILGLEDRLIPAEQRPKLRQFIAAMEKRSSYRMIVEDNNTFGKSFKTN